jgi:hypothetical protein
MTMHTEKITASEILQLRTDLIAIEGLTTTLPARSWRLFGSWAIILQSQWFARTPADIDVDVTPDSFQAHVNIENSICGISATLPSPVIFTAGKPAPTVYRQRIKVDLANYFGVSVIGWSLRRLDVTSRSIAVSTGKLAALEPSMPVLRVAVTPLAECLAQKWTRICTIRLDNRRHTRWQDLADLYDALKLGASSCPISIFVEELARAASDRGLHWPCTIPPAPREWLDNWDAARYREDIYRPSPEACRLELNHLLFG